MPQGTARAIIDRLGLTPHPEGGWYKEIFRSSTPVQTCRGERSALTTIYYLLEAGQISRWHVVDSDEVWHFYCGSPLELLAYRTEQRKLTKVTLDSAQSTNDSVCTIEAGVWQAARTLGEFSLVGCTVGPGFDFSDFRFISGLSAHVHHFVGELAKYAELL